MSTENKPKQLIGPMRREQLIGKRSNDDYTYASAYIRRNTLKNVKIELNRRKRHQQPVTEFSELLEVLLAAWLQGKIDIDELIEREEEGER